MSISGGELYGAIMGLPLVILVLLVAALVGKVTSQTKVHKEDLVFCAGFVPNEEVRSLDVCMNVFLAVNVLEDVQLWGKKGVAIWEYFAPYILFCP